MAGASGVKTRHSSGIKMAEYIGSDRAHLCSLIKYSKKC